MKSPLYIILIAMIIAASFILKACQHASAKNEPFDGKFYIGVPAEQAIVRRQSSESIKCDSPRFATMVCMDIADLALLANQLECQ